MISIRGVTAFKASILLIIAAYQMIAHGTHICHCWHSRFILPSIIGMECNHTCRCIITKYTSLELRETSVKEVLSWSSGLAPLQRHSSICMGRAQTCGCAWHTVSNLTALRLYFVASHKFGFWLRQQWLQPLQEGWNCWASYPDPLGKALQSACMDTSRMKRNRAVAMVLLSCYQITITVVVQREAMLIRMHGLFMSVAWHPWCMCSGHAVSLRL